MHNRTQTTNTSPTTHNMQTTQQNAQNGHNTRTTQRAHPTNASTNRQRNAQNRLCSEFRGYPQQNLQTGTKKNKKGAYKHMMRPKQRVQINQWKQPHTTHKPDHDTRKNLVVMSYCGCACNQTPQTTQSFQVWELSQMKKENENDRK